MTDYERRQLAAQSLEVNLRDENFCELFPELTMVNVQLIHYFYVNFNVDMLFIDD